MYPAPIVTSTVFPSVTTASVTSYPTTLLFNTIAPSIVYQRQISAPVFPNFVPIIGIESTKTSNDEKYFDEKNVDDYIKKRVEEQIIDYQNKNEKYFFPEEKCCCNKYTKTEELTLDEKIDRIREELDLPKERDQNKLIKNLHEYQKRFDKATNTSRLNDSCLFNTKDLFDYTNRDFNIKRSRSKSPSRIRPWIPTGSNYYGHTNNKREDLMNKQRSYIPFNSEQSTSLVFYDHEKPKKETSSLFTVKTYRPSETIFETNIDSKTTIVDRPIRSKQSYCTTNYVIDHTNDLNQSKFYHHTNNRTEPLYYEKTTYPLAKEYYYYPLTRNVN